MPPKPSFIIIGSGIAGLNFALHAVKIGPVLIITKKRTVESGTNYAQGGIAAVLSKLDNFEKHIKDTLEAGSYHNDRKAVTFIVKHGPKAVMGLIEMGVPFATDEKGQLILTKEGGHCERRIAFVGDYTGQEIESTLIKKVKKNPRIKIEEHAIALDLLVKNGICYGVQVLEKNKESSCHPQIKNIFASVTVLATGGLGQIFKYTTNPKISTGDGLGMAYRAGAKFKDLEFIQFHPTALNLKRKPTFLLSEALRGEGAVLRNYRKERFMQKYHPKADLAPRDVVARAVYLESKRALPADRQGSVYLDITHEKPDQIKTRFPQIYQKLLSYGLDLTKDLIPISPAAHYACGGIKVNLKGKTGIRNLYAFGEVTCTGVHGANRLASNSLLEALVFSTQILEKAQKKIHPLSPPRFSKPPLIPSTPVLNQKLNLIKKTLREIMWQKVGIVRNQRNLKDALAQLKKIEKTLPQKGINEKINEVRNMLIAAKLVTEAAFKRKKNLGGHYLI